MAEDTHESLVEKDHNDQPKKTKYPKRVFLIIGSEFCERFSYYGMRTVLVLYVRNFLDFGDDDSTTLFHAFSFLAYFSPLFGGIISDSYWGKYKTIVILSMVYIAGHGIKTLAAIPYIPSRAAHIFLSILGLLVIAIGTGGIKPCVATFGGDQFTADQSVYRKQYFSLFYFSINAGALLAKIIMPIFRTDVNCYPGETGDLFQECYALAFGLPGLLMIIATVLIVVGSSYYVKHKPLGSVFVRFCKCIFTACRNRWRTPPSERNKAHWIDYASETDLLKRDSKYVIAILVIFSPLPLFWALFDQQGSRWTLQALQMDRYWGSYLVKPEQMDTFNPFLIITLIPLFEVTLYPFLRHAKIPFSPIKRMGAGLILAGVSYVVTAIVQFEIDGNLTPIPGNDQFGVRIMNAAPCPLSLTSNYPNLNGATIEGGEFLDPNPDFINVDKWNSVNISIYGQSCVTNMEQIKIDASPGNIIELVVLENGKTFQSVLTTKQLEDGKGEVFFVNLGNGDVTIAFESSAPQVVNSTSRSEGFKLPIGRHNFSVYHYLDYSSPNNTQSILNASNEVDVQISGIYTVYLYESDEQPGYYQRKLGDASQKTDVRPFVINVAWMIPQYIIITVAEIFLSITGLEFAYTQAPPSMKSVVASFWLLTVSLGNVIVVIVAQIKPMKRQAHEFILFACLIGVASIIFILLGKRYTPVDEKEFESDNNEEVDKATMNELQPLDGKAAEEQI